jgi:uncharacterized protein (TIGR03118 family)
MVTPPIPRRLLLQWGSVSALAAACAAAGCKDSGSSASATAKPNSAAAPPANRYAQTNLAANKPGYQAQFTDPDLVNAWGIAIRPKGAGGHFWVGAGGTSFQYVGDVRSSADSALQKLFQDGLKKVGVPGADSLTGEVSKGKITGVAYNGPDLNSENFRVKNQIAGATQFDGSARFVFVTDSGKVTAWTERSTAGAVVRVDGPAALVYDGEPDGSAFFGVAINHKTWDTMWLADFGVTPQIVTLDKTWQKVPTAGFANPFASGPGGAVKPGDAVPFNIQVLDGRVFVTYAISQEDKDKAGAFFVSEEDALDAAAEAASGNLPDKGKLVEFDLSGRQIRIYKDAKRLNAPWGVAIAPSNFGKLSGALLVGNFGGAGRICAFDAATGDYIDDLRDAAGQPVAISGLWALQFGNGESLGDSDALYFAAGPEDESDGLFGSLRYSG